MSSLSDIEEDLLHFLSRLKSRFRVNLSRFSSSLLKLLSGIDYKSEFVPLLFRKSSLGFHKGWIRSSLKKVRSGRYSLNSSLFIITLSYYYFRAEILPYSRGTTYTVPTLFIISWQSTSEFLRSIPSDVIIVYESQSWYKVLGSWPSFSESLIKR